VFIKHQEVVMTKITMQNEAPKRV